MATVRIAGTSRPGAELGAEGLGRDHGFGRQEVDAVAGGQLGHRREQVPALGHDEAVGEGGDGGGHQAARSSG